MQDTIKSLAPPSDAFFTRARAEAERRRLRKERNTIELRASLIGSQTSFINWDKGGDNVFSIRSAFSFSHQYKRDRFSAFYKFDARYGINRIDTTTFKNEDQFQFDFGVARDISERFSYSSTGFFKSQFSRGYKSRTDQTLVSDFMAPGTLTIAGGFTYKSQKRPLTITLSPIAGTLTFVHNEELSAKKAYGVDSAARSTGDMGSALKIDYQGKFFKDKLNYRTELYYFTNYGDYNNVDWKNTIDYTVYKVLTISAFTHLLFDQKVFDTQKLTGPANPVQFNYILGIGLTYVFKNK